MDIGSQSSTLEMPVDTGLQEHSARRFDTLPVDPAVIFRQQGSNHATDIIRQSHASKRRLVGDKSIDLQIVAH